MLASNWGYPLASVSQGTTIASRFCIFCRNNTNKLKRKVIGISKPEEAAHYIYFNHINVVLALIWGHTMRLITWLFPQYIDVPEHGLKIWTSGAGEMVPWLRALDVLPEDTGSTLSTYMATHNCPISGNPTSSYRHKCRQNTNMHKIQ